MTVSVDILGERNRLRLRAQIFASKLATELQIFRGNEKWIRESYERLATDRSASDFTALSQFAAAAAMSHARACVTYGVVLALIELIEQCGDAVTTDVTAAIARSLQVIAR
jgi:hypothetical protein